MPITAQELTALETRINTALAKHNAKLVLSAHFTGDRVNHVRNVPPITLAELEAMLQQVVSQHVGKILALNDQATFNLRCGNSHINIPCGLAKATGNGAAMHEITAITVMRNPKFYCKDPTEFHV
ncbi:MULTISPECIES: hypothetical protein [Burkholderia]|uniref:hypothetical protein n=1 Tax=Burkholderia TaxID=32008 RepID=UPI0006AC8483|nr:MULTISPECIES: hypothetical protein [Burkholderia]KOR17906.1 hypothetical protein ABW54_29635 [Burkholderia cenocepacia]